MVSSSLPEKEGSGEEKAAPLNTYAETFEKLCPYYIAIGMTYDQYWNGDPEIAKFYRQAQKTKMSLKNRELWLMGAYIYEALCDVSPVLNANAKKGTKPLPWRSEPIPITKEEMKVKEEKENKARYIKNKKRFESMVMLNNKRFEGG
ncbi:MAG: hypothetical protein IK072_01935 [Clostridia bacterium]|nr:hypothetical protein [Clostridia bacterium]